MTPVPEGRIGFDRRDPAAVALVCGLGLLLSVLPHLIWWTRLGTPVYIADHDELLYLSVTSQAYFNHPTRLGDPLRASRSPSLYPESQFVPAVVLARRLGWGPLGVSLVWRVWAGLSLGMGLYLVARHFVGPPWPAAGVAVLLLADVGLCKANPLWQQALVSARTLGMLPERGLFDYYPMIHTQWRIITPGLSLAFLLGHVWLLARARERPSRTRLALSGLGFGLLFHVYFYFWTAAGLALAMALVIDPKGRRASFHTGWIGGLIGLPAIVAGALVKRSNPPDWLLRSDTFLPIPRFSELAIPITSGLLLSLGLAWLWVRQRGDLTYFWALATSGWALSNSQVVTGLQIQNFHWFYVWGPATTLLIVLLAAGELMRIGPWTRAAAGGLVIGLGMFVAVGVWLRVVETTRTEQTRAIMADLRAYRAQQRGPAAVAWGPNTVVAGESRFVDLATVLQNVRPLIHYAALLSPTMTDDEWDERIALNAYLLGRDRDAFAAESRQALATGWGPWVRDTSLRARRVAQRLAAFDAIAAGPGPVLDRYRVRHVARSIDQPSPPPGPGWALRQAGPSWRLWEREARVSSSD